MIDYDYKWIYYYYIKRNTQKTIINDHFCKNHEDRGDQEIRISGDQTIQ